MWVKVVLALLFCVLLVGAVHFAQPRPPEDTNPSTQTQHLLTLLTWNIGYAELEDDTRAHTKDLPAVAEVILKTDPDAVALQELAGIGQVTATVITEAAPNAMAPNWRRVNIIPDLTKPWRLLRRRQAQPAPERRCGGR